MAKNHQIIPFTKQINVTDVMHNAIQSSCLEVSSITESRKWTDWVKRIDDISISASRWVWMKRQREYIMFYLTQLRSVRRHFHSLDPYWKNKQYRRKHDSIQHNSIIPNNLTNTYLLLWFLWHLATKHAHHSYTAKNLLNCGTLALYIQGGPKSQSSIIIKSY